MDAFLEGHGSKRLTKGGEPILSFEEGGEKYRVQDVAIAYVVVSKGNAQIFVSVQEADGGPC